MMGMDAGEEIGGSMAETYAGCNDLRRINIRRAVVFS